MATFLIRMTSAPYGSSNANDGLNFAMSATNYGHEVSILFEFDGIFQLATSQSPSKDYKNHAKQLKALPFFDVEPLFVCQDSFAARKEMIALHSDEMIIVNAQQKRELINDADFVVSF